MPFKVDMLPRSGRYNLHSHTEFCDGHAPMDVMADAAVAAGMELYGFSPHSPVPFASPCNMKRENVEAYLNKVQQIRIRRKDSGCRFLASMEIDYFDDDIGPATSYFQNLPLDYRIGSVHFIPDFQGEPVDIDGSADRFRRNMSDRFRGDLDYVVDTYFSQSRSMLAAGGFDILGHLDKVGQNAEAFHPGVEDGEHYKACVDAYISDIVKSGIIVELNTKARARSGRFFPKEDILGRLVRAGVSVVVNSDAHDPALINASRDEALALVRSLYSYV